MRERASAAPRTRKPKGFVVASKLEAISTLRMVCVRGPPAYFSKRRGHGTPTLKELLLLRIQPIRSKSVYINH